MTTKKFDIIEEFVKQFNTGKNRYYRCKCQCGNIFESSKLNVDIGKTKSCNKRGCHSAVIKMIGKKFGRLTVLHHKSRTKGYTCKCECGNITVAKTFGLKTGKHLSCGCMAKEYVARRAYKGNGVAALNSIYRNYKRAASKRGYCFELTKNEFEKLITENCHYCGTPGSMTWKLHRKLIIDNDYKYNGVDRVNNKLGYISTNCVSCCNICNNSKSTLSVSAWKEWIVKIYNEFIQKHSFE
mgnify:CR=1 FL=1